MPASSPIRSWIAVFAALLAIGSLRTDAASRGSRIDEATVTAQVNRAPVPNAGPDQTVTLPNSAVLTATAIDDGLPAGSSLNFKWSVDQGSAVSIESSRLSSTKVVFAKPGTYVLRVTVDDGALSAFDTVTIVVLPDLNQAPSANAGPDQTITLPSTATLIGAASDDGLPSGSKLTTEWLVVSGGGVKFADPASAKTTASFGQAGKYILRLTANDGRLKTADDVVVIVNEAPRNRPPVVNAGADQRLTLPSLATLQGTVTDDGVPAGGVVTVRWSVVSGGAATFSSPDALSTTVQFEQAGNYVLRLTASDGAASAAADVGIKVAPADNVNQAPTVSAGPDRTIALPQAAALAGSGSDDGLPAGSALSYAWSVVTGSGVTFGTPNQPATSATFSGAGTYVLQLTASDGALSSSDTVTVVVNPVPPVNQAPVVNAGTDQAITLPAGASLAGSVSDDGLPSGSTVTTQWSVDSGGSVSFANAASASTTATFTQAGTYVLRLTASDGSLSAADTVTIVVSAAPVPNQPPTVSAGPDQTITLPATASLIASASDDGLPAGSTLAVQWSVVSGGAVTLGTANAFETSATFPQAGTFVLRATASDGVLSASDTVTVIVNPAAPANAPPVVSAGPDQAIMLPGAATLQASATDDGLPAGSTLLMQWSRDSGPAGVSFSAAGAAATTATFTVPGTYVLRFAASDGAMSAFDTVVIEVAPTPPPVNQPPTVNAGNDQAVTLPTNQVSLLATAGDDGLPTGSIVTTWSKDSGPGTVVFGNPSSTSTSATFEQAGTFVLRVTVSDGLLSTFDTISVVVSPPLNQAPVVQAGVDLSITLPANVVALSGDASDDGLPAPTLSFRWLVVSGPNVPVFGDPFARQTSATFSIAGTYVLRLTATDGDRSGSDDLTVVVNPGAPPPPVNRDPIANAGGPYTGDATTALGLTAAASSDPDGDSLTYAWTFGDGQSGSGRTPTHAWADAGTFTVTLTVTDGRGGSATATAQATIGPPLDRAPPSVQLRAPARVLPGEQFTAIADAADNVGVAGVVFEINAANPLDATNAPYQRSITAPPLASPGTVIALRATARDAQGNTAAALANVVVTAAPDIEPPALDLQAPAETAPGAQLVITALATDNVGVASVTFSSGVQSLATDQQPPYELRYSVPATAVVGSTLTFSGRAADAAGNATTRSVSVLVVAAPDTAPPAVSLTAPAETAPGSTITLNATATDNAGVAQVQFFVDDVPIAVDTVAPYSVPVAIAASRSDGSIVRGRAVATDFAGLTASSSAETIVRARSLAVGTVFGEVYDDTSGLPMAGAVARLDGLEAGGTPYTAQATSDARGRYFLQGREGDAHLTITKPGWTTVSRTLVIPGTNAVEAIDARLSALSPAVDVTAVLGRTIETDDLRAIIPAGALGADRSLSVTRVSGQGLAGLLPIGWSPIASVELSPRGVGSAEPMTISARQRVALPPSTPIAVAAWDETAHGWRVLAITSSGAAGAMLDAPVSITAPIVWAIADIFPAPPPVAVAGELLGGVEGTFALGAGDTVAVSPQPNVMVYQPGVRSLVEGVLTAASPTPSGLLLRANLRERYEFFSSAITSPDPFQHDLVFYQRPGTPASLSASFAVSPSLTFESAFLRSGVITVEIIERGLANDVSAIDAAGGTASALTGETIVVPAGALTATVPTTVARASDAELGVALPQPLQFVAAASVSFSGALLAQPATLTVPRPDGVVNDDGLVLLQITSIDGASRLALVGVGRIAGDRIVSDTAVPGVAARLPGVRAGGRYVFARVNAPSGFATGLVRGIDAAPFANALVTVSTLPVVGLSGADGRYVAVALSGPVALQALDIARRDSGVASGVLNAGGILNVNLSIALEPPQVTSVTPSAGGSNVSLGAPVIVSFSEPIDPSSIGALRVEANGTQIPGTVSLSDNNRLATFRATAGLASATSYTVRVTTALLDLSGRALTAEFASSFTSINTAPPPAPPAGSVSATMPGGDGLSTVTGTQGSAGLHDVVDVVNTTQGTSTRALVNPDGSFSTVIAASLGDRLQIIITNQGGGQTIAGVPPFARTNPDGSRSVVTGASGGRLEGPSGIVVEVPEGAFGDGTVVTMKYVDEASFPIPLTADQRALFAYSGGVSLDFGGATPSQYINVSIPAAPGDTQTDRWVLGAVRQLNGSLILDAIDTARVIRGQITTASPPCPGVQAAATYGYIKSTTQPVGVVYGQASGGGGSHVYGMEIVNPYSTTPLVMPWSAYNSGPAQRSTCFPILMGRTTVTPNTQRIAIQADQFAPTSREIVVQNTSSGARLQFPRNVVEYRFVIGGTTDDSYRTSVITPDGEVEVPHEISPAAVDFVVVRLDMNAIFANVSEVVIRNISRNPVEETRLPQAGAEVVVPVSGGAADTYAVTLRGEGTEITPAFQLRSPNGAGNLVARVLPVTIDPGTNVVLINATQGSETTVPSTFILDGGMEYPFTAAIADRFGLRVDYLDGRPSALTGIPAVRIVVRSGETGRVIRVIESPVPPLDEPFFNLGAIDGDTSAPRLIASPGLLMNFDPSAPMSFRFSEGIDRLSALDGVTLTDDNGQDIEGEVRLSNENTVVTFVPSAPLELGMTFRLRLAGLTDGSGNVMRPFEVEIRTFEPRKLGDKLASGTINGTVRDIAFLDVPQTGAPPRRYAYEVIDDGNVAYLVTLDLTDPQAPVQLSSRIGGNSSVMVVSGVTNMLLRAPSPCGGAMTFTGNLAITTNFTTVGSAVQFWDLSNPAEPCMMGSKLLTVNPSFAGTNRGAVQGMGRARRAVAVKTQAGVIAYIAVEEMGLFMIDVGGNSPSVPPADSTRPPFAAGNYTDVIDTGSMLIAAERNQNRIDFFDTSLTMLNQMSFGGGNGDGGEVLSLAYAPGWGIDDDQNGIIDQQEVHNLLFVGASIAAGIVDITNLDAPVILGAIPTSGPVFRIAVDVANRRVYFGGARTVGGNDWVVQMFDLGGVNPFVDRDGNNDGLDDRIVWQSPQGLFYLRHNYRAMAIDTERGLLYVGQEAPVGATAGLDVWGITNICCDLAVEMAAAPDDALKGDREETINREKRALQQGLGSGLAAAAQSCGVPIRTGLPITQNSITIIEQGSGACLWKDNPAADCSPAYQPGLSDHDYEVFIPSQYMPGNATSGGECVVDILNRQFTDANEKPIPIDIGGGVKVIFKDITFFPVKKEGFENARLDVDPPLSKRGDTTGDLGLGRQQLLMKWVLEGEYVELPGWNVTGRALEDIMTELRDGTGIPPLEGFEWAALQRFNLVKSRAFLRIQGSSVKESAFHELFISQLHDAGKTGIRAALARMVADENASRVVLDVTRGSYASDACLLINSDTPLEWPTRPCGSFEEYVASAAGRTLRHGQTLFTLSEVRQEIYRFFQVKADEGPRIPLLPRDEREPAADQFIAMASRFIDRVATATEPIYQQTIGSDPNATQRGVNMQTVQSRTTAAMASAKLQVIPRASHRGFVGVEQVALSMYRGRPTDTLGTHLKTVRVTLAANETRYMRTDDDLLLPEMADGLTEEDRNLNDLASGTDSTPKPLFMLGDGSDENPYINYNANIGAPRYVAFTFDLPEKKAQEAVRRNNYDGFFYYVLDRLNAVHDQSGPVPLPIEPVPGLLDPDEHCIANLDLQVTQHVTIVGGDAGAGAVNGDWVLARAGETLVFHVTAKNNSAQELENVLICNSAAESGHDCEMVGNLGPSQEATREFTMVVPGNANGEYREAVPSVEALQVGKIEGATTRIIISCDDVAVVPAPGNPIPLPESEDAKVMRGGVGLRSYRVVTRNGESLVGHNIEIEVTTPGRGTFVTNYITDLEGRLTLGGDQPYVEVNVHESLPVGTHITARVKSIDGRPSYCIANTDLFTMVATDRTWSRTWQAGASIGGVLSIEAGVTGTAGTGFSFKIDEVHGRGRDKITFGRTFNAAYGTVETILKTEAKGYLFGAGGRIGAKADASAQTVQTQGDEHEFTYTAGQLTQGNQAVLGGLIFSMMGIHPTIMRVLDEVNPVVNTDPFRSQESYSIGIEGAVAASMSAELGWFSRNAHNGLAQRTPVKFGFEFGGGGTAGLGASMSISDAFLKKELTPAVEVKGSFNLDVGFGLGSGQIDRDPIQGQKKLELTTFLKSGFKVALAGGGKLSVTLDKEKTGTEAIKKLTLALTEQKSWGWSLNSQADGSKVWSKRGGTVGEVPKVTYEFSVTDPVFIKKIAARLNSYSALLGSFIDGVVVPVVAPQMSPEKLNLDLFTFIELMLSANGTYTRSIEVGDGINLPSGLGASLLGAGAEIGTTFNLDRSLSYTEATGIIRHGNIYELSRYDRNLFPHPGDATDEFMEMAGIGWNALVALAGNALDYVAGAFSSGNNSVRSNHTAQLDFSGAGEVPFQFGIASWTWQPWTSDTGYRLQRPANNKGPVDVGHYGVGGFHQFLPGNKQLVNPGTLTFFYEDSEVGPIDESTLGIYRWNSVTEDWDFIGGTANPSANTVTATVDRFGLYTMAPPLPAGDITLTTQWVAGGTPEAPTTTETYTTDALRLNTGGVVPDGTLYTVAGAELGDAFVPFGTVLTPDADSSTAGVQVASAGGVLQFTVLYPAASGGVRPMVFSKAGTALAATAAHLRP